MPLLSTSVQYYCIDIQRLIITWHCTVCHGNCNGNVTMPCTMMSCTVLYIVMIIVRYRSQYYRRYYCGAVNKTTGFRRLIIFYVLYVYNVMTLYSHMRNITGVTGRLVMIMSQALRTHGRRSSARSRRWLGPAAGTTRPHYLSSDAAPLPFGAFFSFFSSAV